MGYYRTKRFTVEYYLMQYFTSLHPFTQEVYAVNERSAERKAKRMARLLERVWKINFQNDEGLYLIINDIKPYEEEQK